MIFNLVSTFGILKICLRLNQTKLSCIIFAVLYSLASPALGSAIFVLRSSLSLSIMLLAVSFYKQRQIYFYVFGIASIFIHYGSLLLFAPLLIYHYWSHFKIAIGTNKKTFFIELIELLLSKLSLLILIITFLTLFVMPSLVQSVLQNFISSWIESGLFASRGEALMVTGDNKAVDLSNISMLTQVAISSLCFFKLRDDLLLRSDMDETSSRNLLDLLRFIGRWLIIVIILTAPFDALPYRFGFFNFLYFPLWLIIVPFLSLGLIVKKYSKNLLILFSVVCVFACTFYWTPKREGIISNIVVLEGKALSYNLPKVIEYFSN